MKGVEALCFHVLYGKAYFLFPDELSSLIPDGGELSSPRPD